MEIEIRLRHLLEELQRDRRGVLNQIAAETGLHRHTIRKLYHNQLARPSLDTLGKLCRWLENAGVHGDRLPQALFGSRPSELWKAVVAPKRVAIYQGAYHQIEPTTVPGQWLSLHDADVAAKLVRELSSPVHGERPEVRLEYVPFRLRAGRSQISRTEFEEDTARARRIFGDMRSRLDRETAILICSQRVNYLVENLVADLFGCQPFATPSRPCVPFFFVYRGYDRFVPSVFGGLRHLPGQRKTVPPGTYYLDKDRKWCPIVWKRKEMDAGVVITVRDVGTDRLTLALFGFSGYSTDALGTLLIEGADRFWPPAASTNGHLVGVYICQLRFSESRTPAGEEQVAIEQSTVIPLHRQVLREYLHRPADKT